MIEIVLQKYRSGSIPCPRPVVTIRVRSRFGDYVPLRFVIDTAADLSAMPIALADEVGIFYDRSTPGVGLGLVGAVRKFRGAIHVSIAGVAYHWPCNFLESPALSATGEELLPVLGRAGFLEAFGLCIVGKYLVLTPRSRFRDWCRGVWRVLQTPFVTRRSPGEPL
jgi:hypothetical protein